MKFKLLFRLVTFFLTIFLTAVYHFPAYGESRLSCESILDVVSLKDKVSLLLEEYDRELVDLIPQVQEDIYNGKRYFREVAAEDRLRGKFLLALKSRQSKIVTVEELIQFLDEIKQVGNVQHFTQAVSALDLLGPLRTQWSHLSEDQLGPLHAFLSQAHEHEKNSVWSVVLSSFRIMRQFHFLRDYVHEVLDASAEDYQDGKFFLNQTLLLSIANVPRVLREELLEELKEKYRETKKEIAMHLQAGAPELGAKKPLRKVQFLEAVLMNPEFQLFLQDVRSSQNKEDVILVLEAYLRLFQVFPARYRFAHVLDVAKALQRVLVQAGVPPQTWIEIYGSFPNLLAQPGSSDVDVKLDPGLESLYRKVAVPIQASLIKDTSSVEGRAAELFRHLDEVVARGLEAVPGHVLSVSLRSTTRHKGVSFFEERDQDTLRFLTYYNPITVVVTPATVILRIYDSLSPVPGSLPHVFEIHY